MDLGADNFKKLINQNDPIYIAFKIPKLTEKYLKMKVICASFSKSNTRKAIINDIFGEEKYNMAAHLKFLEPELFEYFVKNKWIVKSTIHEQSNITLLSQDKNDEYSLNNKLSLNDKYRVLNNLEGCVMAGFFGKNEENEQIDAYAHEDFYSCYINTRSGVIYKIKKSVITN